MVTHSDDLRAIVIVTVAALIVGAGLRLAHRGLLFALRLDRSRAGILPVTGFCRTIQAGTILRWAIMPVA